MLRLLLFLLPVVLLGVHAVTTTAADKTAATPGKHWAASVQAETDKDYPTALDEVRAFEQDGGDPFLAVERRGWLHYLAGSFAEADQAYTKARQLQPAALNPVLGLLNVAQAEKDPRKAERAAEAVLRVEPTNYKAQMALAGLHFAEKEYRKAASEYRRVLTVYPDDPDAMSGAGWGAFYLGEKKEAIELFRRLLSISPSYPLGQRGLELASGK